MDKLLSYIKITGYVFATLIIATFIMSIFNYYDIISNNIMDYFKFIFVLFTIFIGSIKVGKSAAKNGWLEGLKFGFILIFILYLFSYLGLEKSTSIKNLLYYLIILTITILGGMIGISKKETD